MKSFMHGPIKLLQFITRKRITRKNTSQNFNIFNNTPPQVSLVTRDFLKCYSCSYYSFMALIKAFFFLFLILFLALFYFLNLFISLINSFQNQFLILVSPNISPIFLIFKRRSQKKIKDKKSGKIKHPKDIYWHLDNVVKKPSNLLFISVVIYIT